MSTSESQSSSVATGGSSDPAASMPMRRPVNVRSILLGLAGVFFVCGLTAYNDYVVNNTYLVGNFLPIGLLLFFITFILLINTPLLRFAPRWAFATPELGVALCMMMVSCAIPSSGMMRYLPANLVGIWPQAAEKMDYANVLREAQPAPWLFPTTEKQDIRDRASDPVISNYMQRTPGVGSGWGERLAAVPWRAWLVPALTWGALIFCIFGAVICLSVVLRRQWVENERLPYPLASVYLALIEPPNRGEYLNALFRNRVFWIACLGVFFVHSMNALHQYHGKLFPLIPISYDIRGLFAKPPLNYIDVNFKWNRLYFCVVGITFFLQSNVALSLWLFYVLVHVFAKAILGQYPLEITRGMGNDQALGAAIPFVLAMLWVGRHHFLLVLRQMFRPPHPGEPQGRYLPYALAGWGLLLFTVAIVFWLWLAGAAFWPALLIVGMCGLAYLIVARLVAETGLIFVQLSIPAFRPLSYFAQSLPQSLAQKAGLKSFFYATLLNNVFGDHRECIAGFMPQALRVADGAAYESERQWRRAIPFTACLLLSLVLGYLVAGGSMLYTEYNYAASADRRSESPINGYAVHDTVNDRLLSPSLEFQMRGGPNESHDRWLHLGIGAALTTVLSILRLHFVGWPLHPVGFLIVYTYALWSIWFSVLIGWLSKGLIVRFGGSSLYYAARPFFIGLIIGEVGAAAFWLVVSLVLNAMGMEYVAIRLLP